MAEEAGEHQATPNRPNRAEAVLAVEGGEPISGRSGISGRQSRH